MVDMDEIDYLFSRCFNIGTSLMALIVSRFSMHLISIPALQARIACTVSDRKMKMR